MKKKTTSSATTAAADLKTLIRSHSAFFDRLVSLVPPKFYISGADDDDRPYFGGLSKAAKESLRKQSRENTKKSRRDRFNPDAPSSTLDLLHQSLENPNPKNPSPGPSSGSVTYEELRARLRQRIEDLRSGRNTRPKPHDTHKRKREEDDDDDEEKVEEQQKEEVKEEKLNLDDLSYGKIKTGESKKKKKKLTKAQALEKAKRLEELKKDPEKGEAVTKKLSWKTAASRAAGEKVHDDPKLIKESIKKEKKRQQKHAEKWKERVESRESSRKEKQKTRSDNIKERIQQKKARRIEKREKKLMRPGFEGRKEGYIKANAKGTSIFAWG